MREKGRKNWLEKRGKRARGKKRIAQLTGKTEGSTTRTRTGGGEGYPFLLKFKKGKLERRQTLVKK